MRKPPVQISSPAMAEALLRLQEFRKLGVSNVPLSRVPPGRVKALARYAALTKAQSIRRMQPDRRIATLLAFAIVYEIVAQDDAIELLNQHLSTVLRKVDNKGKAERLESLPKLDLAALRLRDAVRFLLDAERPEVGLRAAIFEAIAREQLEQDVATIGEISRSEDETRYFDQMIDHYSQMRRFLPMLLRMIPFQSHVPGDPVIEALTFLRRREGKREVPMEKAPLGVVTKNWRRLVLSDSVPDSRFYTLCTLERLQESPTTISSATSSLVFMAL